MTNKKLLIIAFVWPEPSSTAAGSRMMQLVSFFLEEGYQITMASTSSATERSADLSSIGIIAKQIQLNDISFDSFITELDPSVVLFDRFLTEEHFGWRVAAQVPKAIRILDTEDLHSLRQTRAKLFKEETEFSTELWLQQDITKREVASMYRCDLSLIISSYEMHLLQSELDLSNKLLLHLPFMLDNIKDKETLAWPSFETRNDFLCIGNGKHAPNVDAILWLKREIWPLIRKAIPTARLNIYGAYLPNHILQLHKADQGFLVHGWVEKSTTVFENAKINLAPLRFGAGLKGKLINAMQAGTPSVSTAIGTEGMHDNFEWSGAVADTAASFADAAINLYQDKELWHAAQKNGTDIINQVFDKNKISKRFREKIVALQNNVDKQRQANFIGTILQHQTMNSSKYLSKYIAEKNRK